MSILTNKPFFIHDQNGWELCGPFFSVCAVKNGNKYSILLDILDMEAPDGIATEVLYENATDNEEVAKNFCTIYYNNTLDRLCSVRANADDE